MLATQEAKAVSNAYRVDTSRGERNGTVSAQWFSRPDDQKFLTLDALYDHCHKRRTESYADVFEARDIRFDARRDDPESLRIVLPETTKHEPATVEPTHWSFGQVATLLGAPASYLRKLPAPLAAINLQYHANNYAAESVKALVRVNGATELRAVTGAEYGRIWDSDVVDAVRRVAGDRWKVPGTIDWQTQYYNPETPVTKDSTTLYASDRDVFLFLVDDRHPIEVGKLANGEPDLMFRGFYAWNSETGSKTFGLAAMYLRAVCQNRNLWGVEGFKELKFRHSSQAPARFMRECLPALQSFSERRTDSLIAGVNAAKGAKVAGNDDERAEFLHRQGFGKKQSQEIIATVLAEEERKPESVWDFVQGITAFARKVPHADDRVEMEARAGALLDKVKA